MIDLVRRKVRRANCGLCRMADGADTICVTATGSEEADILVVTKHPIGPKFYEELNEYLERAGIDVTTCAYTSAIKCKNYETEPGKVEVKACSRYLHREIEVLKPRYVLLMGNEPLQAALGKSGITKYRGRVYELGDTQVVPTVSLSAVRRNPREVNSFIADLKFLARISKGEASDVPQPDVLYADNKQRLRACLGDIGRAKGISFDVETTGADEFRVESAMVSCSLTIQLPDGALRCWAIPLFHPQSPWRTQWRAVLRYIGQAWPRLRDCKVQVAQNGKFDARWFRQFEVRRCRVTFDTMLAQHTVDENAPRGLKPMARTYLGADPWEVDTKDLLNMPIKDVLFYNALDSWYTWHLRPVLKAQLLKDKRLAQLYVKSIIPASEVYTRSERRGVWIDREVLATNQAKTQHELEELDAELMEWVPDEIPQLTKSKKGTTVNFNPSNFSRWWLFDHLGLPVLARGKDKPDGSEGDPSMAEAVMLELKGEHPVVDLLLRRTELVKHLQFYEAYIHGMDDNDRVHTSFKLYGTVTGRTSSGKSGDDKLVGTAVNKRKGINLQQVPRDTRVRGCFGAPPGWLFVEADYSQVELRVVAFLSRDPRMLYLYQTGQDIHRATAASVLGVPEDQITGVQRKSAKAVNFGFVYGMSANKFVSTAFEKYDLRVSIEEAQEIRKAYFRQFAGLLPWHEKQRRLVRKYKRVASPLGRVRRLPDIDSKDRGVQSEAERQAINSPVQSFASDMTVLSMVLIDREFRRQKLPAYTVGTVHDAVNFEVRADAVADALPIIKNTMETLPLDELFNVFVDVPMVADLKVGTHWGGAHELESEQDIFNWDQSDLANQLAEMRQGWAA